METSQEQNFLNPTNENSTTSASKQQIEDPVARLSSSSSSSCSSIEAEPKPEDNTNAAQLPPTQVMERTPNSTTTTTTTTTSSPTTPPYRIPSHVFTRTTSTAPVEWSTLSNESLFSIHMGNSSFTGREYFKSGELTFPQPPSPMTPSLPSPSPSSSPPNTTTQGGGGGVVEEAKSPVDIAKKAAETDKAYRATKEEEQKAAANIREVIMANEAANKEKDKDNNENNNNNNSSKFNRSVSRRSEDFSRKSFAFPILGNADKGGLQGSTPQKKQTKQVQPETPKISTEAEEDEGLKKEEAPKPVTPKAEPDRPSNRNPRWLSCFPCCATLCG